MGKLIGTAEAATQLGVTEQRIRQLCAEHIASDGATGLPATKIGQTSWAIDQDAVDAHIRTRPVRPPLSV